MSPLPEIRPISELARDARGLVARARARQEPVVITQRGPEVAVVLPVELYRAMERQLTPRLLSPRLVNPEDAEHFKMTLELVRDDTGATVADL